MQYTHTTSVFGKIYMHVANKSVKTAEVGPGFHTMLSRNEKQSNMISFTGGHTNMTL